MKPRDVFLKTRVTEDEAENLKAAALRCGLTQSEFMRMAIKGLQPKPAPPEIFWEHMNILHSIYDGLRNIAYNSGEDSEYARELQEALEKEILRVQAAITLPERIVKKHGGNEDMGD